MATGKTTKKAPIQDYKIENGKKLQHLLHASFIPSYFKTDNVEIQLFLCTLGDKTGNEVFKERCNLDITEARKARKNNIDPKTVIPHNAYTLRPYINPEAEQSDLDTLLSEKFKEASDMGYKTVKAFATNEIEANEYIWKDLYYLFPILKQWVSFLKNVIAGTTNIATENIEIPNLKTIVNHYVLLNELGIIGLLKKEYNFDNLSRAKQVTLLCLIMGYKANNEGKQPKEAHTIKALLSSTRPADKNYPLKTDNVNLVKSELLKIGIESAKKS